MTFEDWYKNWKPIGTYEADLRSAFEAGQEKQKWENIFLEDCAEYDKKIAEEYKTQQERVEELEKEAKEKAEELSKKQILGVYDSEEDLKYDEGYNEGEVVGYEEGYFAGAKPREKRIAELEEEKCELLGIIQGKDKAIKDLEWQLQEVAKDNDNYQEENKELKFKIEKLTQYFEPQEMTALFEQVEEEFEQEQKLKKLEKENAELKNQQFSLRNERNTFLAQNEQYEKDLIDFNESLTKAVELLKRVIRETWGEGWNYSLGVKVEAEKFLKEIEQ